MKEYIYEMPRPVYDKCLRARGEQFFYSYCPETDLIQIALPEQQKTRILNAINKKISKLRIKWLTPPVLVDVFNYTDTDIDDVPEWSTDVPEWSTVDSHTVRI